MRAVFVLASIFLFPSISAVAQRCTEPLTSVAGVPPTTLNPVTLRVVAAPVVPVPVTDGRVHLAYAAQVTNLSDSAVTIVAFEPLDALRNFTPSGRNEVVAVNGQSISGHVRLFGAPPSGSPDSTTVPAGGSGMTFFDVIYSSVDAVPQFLAHRISIRTAGGTLFRTITDPVAIDCKPPVRISPPLVGSGWWNGNGCCRTVNAHRGATLPLNGEIRVPEQFAIDFVQLAPNLTCCNGAVADVSSWVFYGAPVLAVATGVVVAMVDDMPDQVPGPPLGVTVANAAGNHIIQDIGGGRWALYAHLRPGSVTVRVGDTLQAGQRIGGVGNSGSTTAPHLHFQVMDRPSALNATGLPFVFDRLRVEGSVQGLPEDVETDYEAGRAIRVDRSDVRTETNQMPAEGQIFGFHVD